jgi:hypothetical protein
MGLPEYEPVCQPLDRVVRCLYLTLSSRMKRGVVFGHREKYCLSLHAADAAFVYLGAVGPTDGRQQHTPSICPQESTCRCQDGDPNAYFRQYPITPVIAGNSSHGT